MVMSLKPCEEFIDDSDCKLEEIRDDKLYLKRGNQTIGFLEKTVVNCAIYYEKFKKDKCLAVVDYLCDSNPLQIKFTAAIGDIANIMRFFN